ncbi:MAG: glycoside hydrolase family 5 protein [Treponema sp.]|jgi:endoglucanase|nr:glycoside hydrolase family 5 protein [Treponema sp.]
MNKAIKLFGINALTTLIGFSMIACNSNGRNTNSNESNNPTPGNPQPFNDMTAVELVSNMRVGWNLGNTLDCSGLAWLGGSSSAYQLETAWGNPVTKKDNITALKNAGFNVIRLPVSWAKCADKNYTIRANWMARVTEVVNYAVENDMYVILNTHHDEEIFKFKDADTKESLKAFARIWEQIAGNFKNYNEKLIFEGLNEPRTKGSVKEWQGGTPEEHNNLNAHYQVFVNTVRASGGNNDKRFLLVNTYAASGEAVAQNALIIPQDTAQNKIIASYHAYAPYDFALNTNSPINTWDKNKSSDTSPITTPINQAYSTFVSKGIPVIIGEFGAMNKDNVEARAEWAEFYTSFAKDKGIPCVWWDNGVISGNGEKFGLLNRGTNAFTYPEIIDGLMRGTTVR